MTDIENYLKQKERQLSLIDVQIQCESQLVELVEISGSGYLGSLGCRGHDKVCVSRLTASLTGGVQLLC